METVPRPSCSPGRSWHEQGQSPAYAAWVTGIAQNQYSKVAMKALSCWSGSQWWAKRAEGALFPPYMTGRVNRIWFTWSRRHVTLQIQLKLEAHGRNFFNGGVNSDCHSFIFYLIVFNFLRLPLRLCIDEVSQTGTNPFSCLHSISPHLPPSPLSPGNMLFKYRRNRQLITSS